MEHFEQPKQFRLPQLGDAIRARNNTYYIGQEIGRGGFGIVYSCNDEWGNDLVAKILRPHGSYEEIRENWRHEIEKLAIFRHPNITYIHNAFEYQDAFYLIIERCAFSLGGLIAFPDFQGDLWLPYIARDILHGIEFIHNNGYVHKDLHPGNIFISGHHDLMDTSKDPVWSLKIGDVGISRLENDIRPFGTILAEWMLPPEYVDPSQFGQVGKRTDIYHMGLLLLNLYLRPLPAFTETQICTGVPRQLAEALQSPFAPVIAKALRRHVDARIQTPIEMWREILSVMGMHMG